MIADIAGIDRATAVARIAELESELFDAGAWSEAMVAQELDAPARTYLVDLAPEPDPGAPGSPAETGHADPESATRPPVIRGYAGFWYDGDDAELMTIGVGRAYQRQGIAAALLAALIDRARAQGARRMLLEVRVDNDPALALYERFGFRRMGLRRRYYQPGGIDAYTMALDLAPRAVGFRSATHNEGER